jgi:hypothetical protein
MRWLLLSLAILVLCFEIACDSRSKTVVTLSPPANEDTFPNELEISSGTYVEHISLLGTRELTQEPRKFRARTYWEDPLGNIPFAIYEGIPNTARAKKVKYIRPGEWGYVHENYGDMGQTTYLFPVGKTPSGKLWMGNAFNAGAPNDIRLGDDERYDGPFYGYMDRILVGNRSRLILNGANGSRRVRIMAEILEAKDATLETYDKNSPSLSDLSSPIDSLELHLKKASGKLTLYSIGIKKDVSASGDAPAIFVTVGETAGKFELVVEERPVAGAKKGAVCVVIATKIVAGCEPNWEVAIPYLPQFPPPFWPK